MLLVGQQRQVANITDEQVAQFCKVAWHLEEKPVSEVLRIKSLDEASEEWDEYDLVIVTGDSSFVFCLLVCKATTSLLISLPLRISLGARRG